jgi:transposase
VRDNLRVKEVRLDDESGKRWIVCHNPFEAERDAAQRQAALERIETELDRIRQGRERDAQKTNSANGGEDAHRLAECALRDHVSLSRWLRQTATGRLVIDRAKVAAEERLDGKYLLSTSDPDLSAEDVALGYKNLLEAERGFRDLKSTLDIRPVYHRIEPRIRAHVLLCWLALLLIRVAERRTGHTWRRLAIELGRVHAVTLHSSAGTVVQTTPLTAVQQGIVEACGVTAPPRVTHLHPA